MVMVGGFLSTMLPAMGPAVAQLPTMSQTWCVLVEALLVSVPAGTLVVSEKLVSAGLPRPEAESEAEQVMLTSLACQRPSGLAHEIAGGVLSIRTIWVLVASTLPALSVAKNETVVTPSLEMPTDAVEPATVVVP